MCTEMSRLDFQGTSLYYKARNALLVIRITAVQKWSLSHAWVVGVPWVYRQVRETQKAGGWVLFPLPWENSIVSIAPKNIHKPLEGRVPMFWEKRDREGRLGTWELPAFGRVPRAGGWRATATLWSGRRKQEPLGRVAPRSAALRRDGAGQDRTGFSAARCLFASAVTIGALVFHGFRKIAFYSCIWETMFQLLQLC